MRIAVIGSGISGLTAAHYLQRKHEVVLFESEPRLGGHTNTVEVIETEDGARLRDPGAAAPSDPGVERAIPIDTGFIVFNARTYPHFIRLLEELGVAWAKSDMGFSVRSESRDMEYSGKDLGTLYGQRRNLLSPSFHRMAADILRFYREARELLGPGSEETLGDYLRRKKYSKAFIEDHLLPMTRAVWSASQGSVERFPARFLVRFFENHGFLDLNDRPQWLTVAGGARSYVWAVLAGFQGETRMGNPVVRVSRGDGSVRIELADGAKEQFAHVVMACHSDQALALLEKPSPAESSILSRIPYQPNEAVLHTDRSLMPRRKKLWSAWNVHLDEGAGPDAPVALTYWMNRLQPLGARKDYFVTLNAKGRIAKEKVLKVIPYSHPVFTPEGVEAQSRRAELLGHGGISYAGAYWRNGFHEDGVVSALEVCRLLGVVP